MIDEPGWFGAPERALFGWWCRPDDRQARLGVLMAQTVGEEQHNAHHTFRVLAHRLAGAGIASLRLDYDGTGDSLGEWADPDRVDAWARSITVGAEAMRAAGVTRLAVVGMRVGAALAVRALATHDLDVVGLVLWDPCGGKDMLREGQARRPSRTDPPAGFVDTPGYLYDPQTAEDLRALDLSDAAQAHLPERVLVLTRAERPTPRRLRAALSLPGVRWGECVGQSPLLDVPMTDSIVPEETLDVVAEELLACVGHAPEAAGDLVVPHVRLRTPRGGSTLESVVRLGDIGLFGILSEPDGAQPGPTISFVNVANDRHTGPGRRWVQSSRALADDGFRVLRFDQSSTGDSPGHPGQEFGTMYAAEWLGDMEQVVTDPILQGRPPVLIGLCSGAYSAMEVATSAPVDAVYAINVILHSLQTRPDSAVAHPGRRAARPPTRPFAAAQARWGKPASGAWRLYRQITPWNAPAAALRLIIGRGTRVVLVAGRNDGRHFRESAYWQAFGMRSWMRSGRLRFIEDRVIDHPLMTQEGQAYAMNAIRADLLRSYR